MLELVSHRAKDQHVAIQCHIGHVLQGPPGFAIETIRRKLCQRSLRWSCASRRPVRTRPDRLPWKMAGTEDRDQLNANIAEQLARSLHHLFIAKVPVRAQAGVISAMGGEGIFIIVDAKNDRIASAAETTRKVGGQGPTELAATAGRSAASSTFGGQLDKRSTDELDPMNSSRPLVASSHLDPPRDARSCSALERGSSLEILIRWPRVAPTDPSCSQRSRRQTAEAVNEARDEGIRTA